MNQSIHTTMSRSVFFTVWLIFYKESTKSIATILLKFTIQKRFQSSSSISTARTSKKRKNSRKDTGLITTKNVSRKLGKILPSTSSIRTTTINSQTTMEFKSLRCSWSKSRQRTTIGYEQTLTKR